MPWNLRAIAEIVAVISVVLSLIFVGVELRQSTNVAKASSYREITEGLAEQRIFWASDPEVTTIYYAYATGRASELDEVQRRRLDFIITNIFSSYENAYFSRSYGVIGDTEWKRFEAGACTHYQTMKKNSDAKFFFISDEFIHYLDERCDARSQLSDEKIE
jgi:hypothetical protein